MSRLQPMTDIGSRFI